LVLTIDLDPSLV